MLLRVEGELDAYTASAFRRALDEACARHDVVVDLGSVRFVAAEAVGILIGRADRAIEHRFLVAAPPQSWARRVMSLCAYPFPISESVDDALRALGVRARSSPRVASDAARA